jgi:hypothetical protein
MRLAEVAYPSFIVASLGLAVMSLKSEAPECKHAFVPPTLPTIVRVEVPVAPPPVIKRVESSELALVFKVGKQSYVKLGDGVGVKRGRAKHVKVDGIDAAIAPVKDTHAWLGREVIVDGTCKAKVTELAIVARLEGWDEKYTAKQVMEDGVPVLAGKLDGCDGKYARPAELPPVVVPIEIENLKLGDKAKELVLASRVASEVSEEWQRDEMGVWQDAASWDIRVFKHPLTGTTWVSAHAFNEPSCGSGEINLWGLFRVREDGTLVARQLRRLGDMIRIDQLIDIEGDGEIEILGRPWLSVEQMLSHESGETIDEMPLSFIGCPC